MIETHCTLVAGIWWHEILEFFVTFFTHQSAYFFCHRNRDIELSLQTRDALRVEFLCRLHDTVWKLANDTFSNFWQKLNVVINVLNKKNHTVNWFHEIFGSEREYCFFFYPHCAWQSFSNFRVHEPFMICFKGLGNMVL